MKLSVNLYNLLHKRLNDLDKETLIDVLIIKSLNIEDLNGILKQEYEPTFDKYLSEIGGSINKSDLRSSSNRSYKDMYNKVILKEAVKISNEDKMSKIKEIEEKKKKVESERKEKIRNKKIEKIKALRAKKEHDRKERIKKEKERLEKEKVKLEKERIEKVRLERCV